MKNIYKLLMINILVVCLLGTLVGCSNEAGKDTSKTVFNVGDYQVTVNEFNNYLIQTLSCYQVESTQMSDDIKNGFINDTAEEIKNQIILEKMANEAGIELTDDEKAEAVTKNVEMFTTYYKDTVLKEYNVDSSIVEKYFTRVALIKKHESIIEKSYYDEFKQQIQEGVSKEQFCSFDIISFESKESADSFKESIKSDTSYQDMLTILSGYEDYTMTTDRGIYGGFDPVIESTIKGLQDGKLSNVITYDNKPTIILMQKSMDEEFYNQTVNYAATESAKSAYAEDIQKYIEANNIGEIVIDEAIKANIDPEKIYASLCAVESNK